MNPGDIVGFRYSSEKIKNRVEYMEFMVLSEDDNRIYGFRLNAIRLPESLRDKIIKFVAENLKKIDMKNAEKYSNIKRRMSDREKAREIFYNSSNRKIFNILEKQLVSETTKRRIITELFRGIKKSNIKSRAQNLNMKYGI